MNELLQRARAQWQQMQARERLGLSVAAAAVVLLLVWLVALHPALRTLREAPARQAALDRQLALMQAAAAEAQQLRAQPVVSPAQAQAALQAATERLGPEARLTLQGERATLSFSNLPGEQLATWLAEVRSSARARPLELQMQRGERGYGGSLVLGLAGATP